VVMPHDAIYFSEWSGDVEPILLHWCNEAHDINTDGSVGRFLNLDIQVIKQMWDNVIFALQDEHIKENTEIARVYEHQEKEFQCVISPRHQNDDRHLSSLITCSVKVCYDFYELNN
jgi:hypothetical protein